MAAWLSRCCSNNSTRCARCCSGRGNSSAPIPLRRQDIRPPVEDTASRLGRGQLACVGAAGGCCSAASARRRGRRVGRHSRRTGVKPAAMISRRICITALRWDTSAVRRHRLGQRLRVGVHGGFGERRRCADSRRGRTGTRMCPLGCTASNSGSGFGHGPPSTTSRSRRGRVGVLLLPGVGGLCEVVGQLGVRGGLLLVAGPALVEQFPAGVAQFAEDRAQGLQAGHDVGVAGRRPCASCSAVSRCSAGGLAQLVGHHVDALCHVALLSGRRPSPRAGSGSGHPAWWVGVRACPGSGGCSHPRKPGPVTLAMGWIWLLKTALPLPRASACRSVRMPMSPATQPRRIHRVVPPETRAPGW